MRLRVDFGYDGTAFFGWARQPGLRTVQGVLEPAFATVLRLPTPPLVTIAGRTDAGVHARAQVAHVDVPADVEPLREMLAGDAGPDAVARRLNGVLGLDVRVRSVTVAPSGFHARFAALSRRYSYRVADHWFFPPRRHDTLAHPHPLDIAAMNTAAALLLGEHDFAAFCRRREGATTVRTLLVLEWVRDDVGVAIARVEADAFCHSMVRSLIGTLLEVGDGKRDVEWPAAVLAGRDRSAAARVAAAHALTLEEVRYPPDADLFARTQVTRHRRDQPARTDVKTRLLPSFLYIDRVSVMTRTRMPSAQTVSVLAALAADPLQWRYGYELGAELNLKSGSLYPILIRLAERGLLVAEWETGPAGKPARHIYRLTEAGRDAASALAIEKAGRRAIAARRVQLGGA